MKNELISAIANLEEDKAIAIVREKLLSGETAFEIVEQCSKGIEAVGKKYSSGGYYLSDLVMSEAILKEIMKIIEPYYFNEEMVADDEKNIDVVIGTIEGDIHDLGKNIVIYLLRSSGYRVYDLGVDVSPEKFLQAIKTTGAAVIGVCVLLTFCIDHVKKLVDLLEESGYRDKVKVVLGGYPVNKQVQEFTGADCFSNNAATALEIFGQISDNLSKKKK